MATSFKGWGSSWGNSWGPITVDPNAMRGSASITFNASLQVNSGEMQGSASITISATAAISAIGETNSGGYEYLGRRQSPKKRKEERQRLGIEAADIREATQKVARAVVADTGRKDAVQHFHDNTEHFIQMLIAELRGYAMPDMQGAITRQIQIALAIREREEEDELLLLLM